MMSPSSRVSFNGFELDTASLMLFRNGTRIQLAPQPLRLLALLVSRPGELVTREEIRTAIWGERAVEFNQALNYTVSQLRAALEEPLAGPVIETIPRRGYRFLARIATPPVLPAPRRRSLRLRTLTAPLVVAAGLVAVVTLRGRPLIRMEAPVAGVMPAGEAMARAFGTGVARQLSAGRIGVSGVTLSLRTKLEPDSAGVRIRAELRVPGESAPRWRTSMVAAPYELRMAEHDLAMDASAAARRIAEPRSR